MRVRARPHHQRARGLAVGRRERDVRRRGTSPERIRSDAASASATTTSPWFTIVGIAADVKVAGRARSSAGRNLRSLLAVHRAWHERHPEGRRRSRRCSRRRCGGRRDLDRGVPVAGITTLEAIVRESIEQPRFFALLAGAFAILALAAGSHRHLRGDGVCRGAADDRNRRADGARRHRVRSVSAGDRRGTAAHGRRPRCSASPDRWPSGGC